MITWNNVASIFEKYSVHLISQMEALSTRKNHATLLFLYFLALIQFANVLLTNPLLKKVLLLAVGLIRHLCSVKENNLWQYVHSVFGSQCTMNNDRSYRSIFLWHHHYRRGPEANTPFNNVSWQHILYLFIQYFYLFLW